MSMYGRDDFSGSDVTLAVGKVDVFLDLGTYNTQMANLLTNLKDQLEKAPKIHIQIDEEYLKQQAKAAREILNATLPNPTIVTLDINLDAFREQLNKAVAEAQRAADSMRSAFNGVMGGAFSGGYSQSGGPTGAAGTAGATRQSGRRSSRRGAGGESPLFDQAAEAQTVSPPGTGLAVRDLPMPAGRIVTPLAVPPGSQWGDSQVPADWDRNPFVRLGPQRALGFSQPAIENSTRMALEDGRNFGIDMAEQSARTRWYARIKPPLSLGGPNDPYVDTREPLRARAWIKPPMQLEDDHSTSFNYGYRNPGSNPSWYSNAWNRARGAAGAAGGWAANGMGGWASPWAGIMGTSAMNSLGNMLNTPLWGSQQQGGFRMPGVGTGFMSGVGLGGLMFGPQFFAGQMAGRAVLGAINAGAEIEQQMVNVRRVSGMSAKRSDEFLKEMQQIGREKPVAIEDILSIAQTGARAGVSDPDQLAKFTKGASRVGLALAGSGLNEEKAVNGILKIMEVFESPPENIEKFGAALVAVDNASKASTVELINMTQRMSGIFKFLGLNYQQTLGASAAMVDVGLRPEVGTSALSRILMMMGNNMHGMAQNLGFDEGEMKKTYAEDPLKALGRILETFKGAETNSEKLDFIQNDMGLGNIRDIITLSNLSTDFQKIAEYAGIATQEMETQKALSDAESMQSETFNAKMVEVQNAFKELAVVLMQEFGPGLKGAIEAIAKFTSGAAPGVKSAMKEAAPLMEDASNAAGLVNESLVQPVMSAIGSGYGAYRKWVKHQFLYNNDNAPLSLPADRKAKEAQDRAIKAGQFKDNMNNWAAQIEESNKPDRFAGMDEDQKRLAILEEGREALRKTDEALRRQILMGNNQLGMGMGMAAQQAGAANKGAKPGEVLQPFPQGKAIEKEEEKTKREKEFNEARAFEDKQKRAFEKDRKDRAMEQIAFQKEDIAAQKQWLQESKWGLSDQQYDLHKAKHAQATMSDTASLGSATMLESLNSANKGAEEQLADANRKLELQQRELERQTEALNRIAFNTQHNEASLID